MKYNYLTPRAPKYEKPKSVNDCLPRARLLVKSEQPMGGLGPVKKGDKILIASYPDQNPYIQEAVIQALKEEGAKAVDFLLYPAGQEEAKMKTYSVEDGWIEGWYLEWGMASTSITDSEYKKSGVITLDYLREYLDEHPEYTYFFWKTGGGPGHKGYVSSFGKHGSKYKHTWPFNNWEEFMSNLHVYPDELWAEIEKRCVEAIGKASVVRITDPEGTFLEFSLNPEQAKRWQMGALYRSHLFFNPFQATVIHPGLSPVIPDINGVLAGCANHCGFFPRIELYFEHGLLVEARGGGKYGDKIREMMDQYKDLQWPGFPHKGFFWLIDIALCTGVKAFRRTSDMFHSYWSFANLTDRLRAGVIHYGFGTAARSHTAECQKLILEHNLPSGHIHVHNYFPTYEVKLAGTNYWYKITDKGWLSAMDDTEIRALSTKYGDPDELLIYDWVPPLPGINCEGDYMKDYAPDPIGYLKKRIDKGESV